MTQVASLAQTTEEKDEELFSLSQEDKKTERTAFLQTSGDVIHTLQALINEISRRQELVTKLSNRIVRTVHYVTDIARRSAPIVHLVAFAADGSRVSTPADQAGITLYEFVTSSELLIAPRSFVWDKKKVTTVENVEIVLTDAVSYSSLCLLALSLFNSNC